MEKFLLNLSNESATHRLAVAVAECLEPVDCLLFYGEVGAGKTTFIRYLLQNLGVSQAIISPSFMLMQEYEVRLTSAKNAVLWHIDGYRVENESEIWELGIEEIAESSILCIEWPEKILSFLPDSRMEVTLKLKSDGTRDVTLLGYGSAKQKVEHLAATYDA